jgi:hypothetical protein
VKEARIWQPVVTSLERWETAGPKAPLWLRDDDAVEPSPALDRLIRLARGNRIPIALSIIPASTGEALAGILKDEPHVEPIVHGWAHRSHAPEGEKKQEFGLHRPMSEMHDELARALHRLRELYQSRLVPIFVPPWNRIAPQVAQGLGKLGYSAISAFGQSAPEQTERSIPQINTHVDLIDFRGTRRCRDHGVLASSLAATLDHSLTHGRYPIGVLSHHLDHDDAAFEFLEGLFAVSKSHRWLPARELVDRRVRPA